ncbi:MAG: nitroreductase family protein, partial [Candidatus Thorarchaeota archaeon]
MKELGRFENADSFFSIIEERRSIRKYRKFQVPDNDIARIFRAAQLAPSTNNSQPWRFIVVRTSEMKKILAEAAGGQQFIAEANAVVVVLGMREASCCPNNPAKWYALDTMIAAEHLIL